VKVWISLRLANILSHFMFLISYFSLVFGIHECGIKPFLLFFLLIGLGSRDLCDHYRTIKLFIEDPL
jgi:hypothetical protein